MYRRKLVTIRTPDTIIVRPSLRSSAVQLAATKDFKIVDIPKIYPLVVGEGRKLRWSNQNTIYHKLHPTLAWAFKYYRVKHECPLWDPNATWPFPIACFTPCFPKCLIFEQYMYIYIVNNKSIN